MTSRTGDTTHALLKKILSLSFRVSVFSPPMKPFVRFAPDTQNQLPPHHFWDFDDLMQKTLLQLACDIVSPDRLVQACIEQWQSNLDSLYETNRALLQQGIREGADHDPRGYRAEYINCIATRVAPGGRLLYVGAGSGAPCVPLAKRGLRVVGIDTLVPLLQIARGWAEHLAVPADFVGMDVARLGFRPESFDGFAAIGPGMLPTVGQRLAYQRGLALVLKPDGRGIVSALRKKYASYWFLMGKMYPQAMINWLVPQAALDFYYARADASEERLIYGLYDRSHTVESLSAN